ncbi:13904_t:CDS:2, partial [Funneliformis geosporum]
MTPNLWKFTQELASLSRINDIDKEKIKCVSIHAITNAALEQFISPKLKDYGPKNKMSDSDKFDGLETRKHLLVKDEEFISIKRRQMDMKSPNVEWIIDDINISESFFSLKEHAISMANEHKLTYSNHPGEMLALNSILLLEENSIRAQLNIPSDIRRKVFKQMKDMYPKQDLPNVVNEFCRRCAKIARENSRINLEDSIEDVYDDLKKNSTDKHLLRTCQKVWGHIVENWRTSFDDPLTIDTYVHHLMHFILRPFFPDELGRTVNWANKMSLASAARKIDSDGEGHRPDFMFTIDLNGYTKFEIVFGLFKSPIKANSQLINVDLVDLGVLMKDSLDNIYNKGVELEMVVFGIHSFGYNIRIYAMDLSYDGIYRMFLLGEYELPRSNISLGLVEFVLYEIVNLKRLIGEFIEKLPLYRLTNTNNNEKTPTGKIMMIRKTLATPKK